jgi:hypothetical protein
LRVIRLVVPALFLAAATGSLSCKYSFSNPADRLAAGQISGRTLADVRVLGAPVPEGGISVSLKGSAYDQVTHPTGRFTLLPLPPGTHTLLFRRGTELALTRRVELALGPDGQPAGVSLGDLDVPFAGVIHGTVSLFQSGLVVDEITGATGFAMTGEYDLPAVGLGLHRLKVGLIDHESGAEWVGGPLELTLPPEAQSSITRAALVSAHPAVGTGRVRVRLVSLHPDIAVSDMSLLITELVRGVYGGGTTTALADGTVELDAPEGVYELRLSAHGPHAAEVTNPPPATVVVLTGEVADAGTLYLVPPGLPAAAQLRCEDASDCGDLTCDPTGQCVNWSPPPAAPASLPFCYARMDFCADLWSCSTPAGQGGWCVGQANGTQACVPCDTACTVDGTNVLQAPPQGPISPTGQCG